MVFSAPMNTYFKHVILQCTGAESIGNTTLIQELWSGYGQILRMEPQGGPYQKHRSQTYPNESDRRPPPGLEYRHRAPAQAEIAPPPPPPPPYQVETTWYERYSTTSKARVPRCLAVAHHNDDVLIVLEDLNSSGYPPAKVTAPVDPKSIGFCSGLAQFHASFMGIAPDGLWEQGTYWHLKTRPQELEALTDKNGLKNAAELIDHTLRSCSYKTLVHGDAKLANFCFSSEDAVAAVDFQYTGGGCGMQDVAYFIGSLSG